MYFKMYKFKCLIFCKSGAINETARQYIFVLKCVEIFCHKAGWLLARGVNSFESMAFYYICGIVP